MRRLLALGIVLVCAPSAHAAPPAVAIESPALLGQAPFDVTLTAIGEAERFTWDFGDGAVAEGRTVQHRYETGRYAATVTAWSGGESAQARVIVTALTISLAGPKTGTFGRRLSLSGRLRPSVPGARLALRAGDKIVGAARAGASGRFRFRPRIGSPTRYEAHFGSIASNVVEPRVRPSLDTALPRSRMVGKRLILKARVRPAGAAAITVRLWRSGRRLAPRSLGLGGSLRLPSSRPGNYVVQISVKGVGGFAGFTRTLRTTVHVPYLGLGSRGPSVRILERRLAELRYVVRVVDGLYAWDTYEAVLAFQKVHGLRRTGQVGPALWTRLRRASRPRPRYARGHHLEVDKRRQVLFEVRGGAVVRVVHVSTGATGNTPVGRWRVYRKVIGWDWVLWYPMYFLRGFAVHGYPSVPAYPASHGCVRVPMWIAPSLFAGNPYGQTVYVY
jgi:hypothetical protein